MHEFSWFFGLLLCVFSGLSTRESRFEIHSQTAIEYRELHDVPEIVKTQDAVLNDTLTIMAVGDMMLGSNYPFAADLPPNDGLLLLEHSTELLSRAHVTFGNCEGTFLDNGGQMKQRKDSVRSYLFRQPEYYALHLANAGFDVMSLANNHSGDFGREGRTNTMATLESVGVRFAGLLDCPTVLWEKDGVRYGLAAFAPNAGCADLRHTEKAAATVAELATKCDVCMVSFHAGAEGPGASRVTDSTEYYLGENRGNVRSFAHAMIDAGADMLFGHGPHVLRGMEIYQDRLIAYSLGNFCTYSQFSLRGSAGLAPLLEVHTDRTGRFLSGQIHSFKQEGRGGPVSDETQAAARAIAALTENDFPHTGPVISPLGRIGNR